MHFNDATAHRQTDAEAGGAIRCLRQVAARCSEMMILETQVCDEIEGQTEWGRQECQMPYQGGFALIDETCFDDNPETGASPLALCPSPKPLETILRALGFTYASTLKQGGRGMGRRRDLCDVYKNSFSLKVLILSLASSQNGCSLIPNWSRKHMPQKKFIVIC